MLEILDDNIIKVRKSLLIVAAIGLAFSYLELKLTKLEILGSEFEIKSPEALQKVFGWLILYYLISFLIRIGYKALTDKSKNMLEWIKQLTNPEEPDFTRQIMGDTPYMKNAEQRLQTTLKRKKLLYYLYFTLEYLFPVLLALITLIRIFIY